MKNVKNLSEAQTIQIKQEINKKYGCFLQKHGKRIASENIIDFWLTYFKFFTGNTKMQDFCKMRLDRELSYYFNKYAI